MIPIIPWPSSVPRCVKVTSPQGGLQNNVRSFAPEVGEPLERPKTTWTPEVYSIEFELWNTAQFIAFQLWYKRDLAFGVYPFEFFHPITLITSPWRVVKGDPPYRVGRPRRTADPLKRSISVSMTIMSHAGSIPDGYLLQEQDDYILQEQEDKIIVTPGFVFDATA